MKFTVEFVAKNPLKSSTDYIAVALVIWLTLLTACAPAVQGMARIRLSVHPRAPSSERSAKALSVNLRERVDLPSDYCYAVHVTGDEPSYMRLSRKALQESCSNGYPGLGLVVGFLDNNPEAAAFLLPAGVKLRFDLFGFPISWFGGRCPDELRAGIEFSGHTSSRPEVVFYAGEDPISWPGSGERPTLFASGVFSIGPGSRELALEPVIDSKGYLGTEYGCNHEMFTNAAVY
jgi:hypothetical protein